MAFADVPGALATIQGYQVIQTFDVGLTAGGGPYTVKAGVSGRRFAVVGVYARSSSNNTQIQFTSDADPVSGTIEVPTDGGFVASIPLILTQTVDGEDLRVVITGSGTVSLGVYNSQVAS